MSKFCIRLAVGTMVALLAWGCARQLPGEEPTPNTLYYPIGVAVHGGEQPTAYVVSSNFDLRYNSGWVSVVDVTSLVEELYAACDADDDDVRDCAIGEACVQVEGGTACRPVVSQRFCREADPNGVGCVGHQACVSTDDGAQCLYYPDYTGSIVQRLRVPSLAGQLAVANDGSVGVLVARGGAPITRIEMAEGRNLSCGDPDASLGLSSTLQRTDCDRDHLTRLVVELSGEEDDIPEDLPRQEAVAEDRTFLPDAEAADAITPAELLDPFAVELLPHPQGGHTVAVGFLTGGFLSLLRLPEGGLLDHELLVGRFNTGVGALAVHPGFAEARLAATSQILVADNADLATVYDFNVAELLAGETTSFRSIRIGDELGGQESLDLVFNNGGTPGKPLRAYLANRFPDGVTVLDAEPQRVIEVDVFGDPIIDPQTGEPRFTEVPRYVPIGAITIPGRPSGMAYVPRTTGFDRLAVASFDSDSVFILSVLGDSLRLDRRLEGVGAGPFYVEYLRVDGRDLLFVSVFFDHGLTVIDVTPEDPQDITVLGMVRNLQQEAPDELVRR